MTPGRLAELREKVRLMPRRLSETSALAAAILLTVDRRGSLTVREAVRLFGRRARLVVRELSTDVRDPQQRLLVSKEAIDGHAPEDDDEVVLSRAGRAVVTKLAHLAFIVATFEPTKKRGKALGKALLS